VRFGVRRRHCRFALIAFHAGPLDGQHFGSTAVIDVDVHDLMGSHGVHLRERNFVVFGERRVFDGGTRAASPQALEA
jgi:hypothetical protein